MKLRTIALAGALALSSTMALAQVGGTPRQRLRFSGGRGRQPRPWAAARTGSPTTGTTTGLGVGDGHASQ